MLLGQQIEAREDFVQHTDERFRRDASSQFGKPDDIGE
jgi:hypothetical protein